jgi:hypothetical protein
MSAIRRAAANCFSGSSYRARSDLLRRSRSLRRAAPRISFQGTWESSFLLTMASPNKQQTMKTQTDHFRIFQRTPNRKVFGLKSRPHVLNAFVIHDEVRHTREMFTAPFDYTSLSDPLGDRTNVRIAKWGLDETRQLLSNRQMARTVAVKNS